jgi:bacteriorhodopsin
MSSSAMAAFSLDGTDAVSNSFSVAYLLLFSYTVVTLIEALTTDVRSARHIMNLETAVSVVAGYFYLRFARMAQEKGFRASDVMPYRYLDWSITTPLLLLAMMLYFSRSSHGVRWQTFGLALVLDLAMLGTGYLGESGRADRTASGMVSFAFFAGLVALVWSAFGAEIARSASKKVVFVAFAVIWASYGIVYYVRDERTRALSYNTLDVVAKAMLGMYMWATVGRVLM